MSYWDQTNSEKLLSGISKYQLIAVAYVCITHAYAEHKQIFEKRVSSDGLDVVNAAIADLRLAAADSPLERTSEETRADLERIAPDLDFGDGTVPGWEYIRVAVDRAFAFIVKNDVHEIYLALDQAYQSIAGEELNRMMLEQQTGLCGDEIDEAEKRSPACRAEIAFQLDAVHRARRGEALL